MEIIKASGEKESYDREKLCNSLLRAGATADIVERVCRKVEIRIKPGITTERLHAIALQHLRKENPALSARYNLKRAIMELGPAGFLFERYVAAILQEYGYTAKVNQILQGVCVSHEIDIVADLPALEAGKDRHFFVEVKYHNERGTKSDVTVAMYSYARFLDIKEAVEKKEHFSALHEAWIVTNTKFTSKAIEFAECRKIKMTGWHYPERESLESLIEQKFLYPVTVLPSLSRSHWEQCARAGLMFARDVIRFDPPELAKNIGISVSFAKGIIQEALSLVRVQG